MLHESLGIFHNEFEAVDSDAATRWYAQQPNDIFPIRCRFRFDVLPEQAQYFSGEVPYGAVQNHSPCLQVHYQVCNEGGQLCLLLEKYYQPAAAIV